MLDPGRGKTKTGYLWAVARVMRDACLRYVRPWGGTDPPAVAYSYAPGRGAKHAVKLLGGFTGVLQVDGYSAYKQLTASSRIGGPVTLAYCWSHLRRKFYEVYVGGHSPIATEALLRIKELYAVETQARGLPPDLRRRARQDRSKPIVEALKPWFQQSLAAVPKGGKIGEALAYGLGHWDGRTRFLDDGRIEIGSNTVERSIRGLALNRKNALFAGHDLGAQNLAQNWAMTGVARRELQIERGRPARLDDRHAHQARQPLAGIAHRRADALGLCKARVTRRQRGVVRPLTLDQGRRHPHRSPCRLGMFSSRLMVDCEQSAPPLSGQRPTASFRSGSVLSRSRSLPSS